MSRFGEDNDELVVGSSVEFGQREEGEEEDEEDDNGSWWLCRWRHE